MTAKKSYSVSKTERNRVERALQKVGNIAIFGYEGWWGLLGDGKLDRDSINS